MREWRSSELDQRIKEKIPGINRALLRARRGRATRRRPRDKGEQDVLDLLCKRKWEDGLAQGEVKIISS